MTQRNEDILKFLKNRKITENPIRNKKNTPKDYNVKSEFIKNDTNTNNSIFLDPSMEEYYNKNFLPINNIKKYSSLMRSMKEDTYKWKLLHKRLLLSSKIETDDSLCVQYKKEADWLKKNQKDTVILNKSNVYSKIAPSVKNCKENYNIYTLPTRSDIKCKLYNQTNLQLDNETKLPLI